MRAGLDLDCPSVRPSVDLDLDDNDVSEAGAVPNFAFRVAERKTLQENAAKKRDGEKEM